MEVALFFIFFSVVTHLLTFYFICHLDQPEHTVTEAFSCGHVTKETCLFLTYGLLIVYCCQPRSTTCCFCSPVVDRGENPH